MRHHATTLAGGVCLAVSLTIVNAAGQAPPHTPNAPPPPRDPQAIVLDMLQSPDPRQQAWGAWWAGRDTMKDLVPAITTVVAQHQAGGTTDERAATEIALDALIQLRATIPSDVLAVLLESETRATQALILASHRPYGQLVEDDVRNVPDDGWRDALIASMLRHDGDAHSAPWFAAANLLLETRAPGLGRALVTNVRIEVPVFITETGVTGIIGLSGMGMGIGCGFARDPLVGLPPWAFYELTSFASRGNVVVATGPVPIYYERTLTNDGQASGVTSESGPRFEDRLRYIAELLNVGEDALPMKAHESREVKRQEAAALATAMQRIRADVQGRFTRLLETMIAANVLDRGEAASIVPTIELKVEDVHRDESEEPDEPEELDVPNVPDVP